VAAGPRPLPEGASVVIPRLFCRDPAAAIDYYCDVFGARERLRRPGPDGGVAHAMLTFGPAMVMIESEWPTLPSRAPALDGSSPVVVYLYVEDVDRVVERAVAAGGKLLIPASDQFWGDRIAWLMDPSGHVWTVATRVEETTEDQRAGRWSDELDEME